MRGNVSYDHGTMVRWSPDSKAYVVHRATENAPEVYKINRRDDGSLGNIQGFTNKIANIFSWVRNILI